MTRSPNASLRPALHGADTGAEPAGAFTPGPWELREYGSPRGTYFVEAGPTRILSSMKCGEANARLIAAAPDLLSALERVTYALRLVFSQKPLRDMAETLAEADAAIAKALGREAASPADV